MMRCRWDRRGSGPFRPVVMKSLEVRDPSTLMVWSFQSNFKVTGVPGGYLAPVRDSPLTAIAFAVTDVPLAISQASLREAMTCSVRNHPPMPMSATVARSQNRMMGSVQQRRLAAGVMGRGGAGGAGGALSLAMGRGAIEPA